ncbi:MAG: hypothetical protein B6230_03605 [Desulfobacteraceae bacterium 4572_89]|nr:MAG: hypothetical protein B6230_03605 [Desulfobacteraceae bacterium 4572_89]
MEKTKKKIRLSQIISRIVLSLAVLGAGILAMNYFKSMKKPPHKGRVKEQVLQVNVKKAFPRTVQTRLKGFGIAQPVTIVKISSEVAGRIIYTHPGFEKGRTLQKGEVLFKIDNADYLAVLNRLKAGLAQKKSLVAGIKKQFKAEKLRLKTIQRTMKLSRVEYDRVRVLLEENSIGNRSEVDKAEQSLNNSIDTYDKMKQAISLYPLQIKEADAGIESVKADMDKAAADLARCTVAAPFTCRIKSIAMKKGEFATRGKEVVTLADDSSLEIEVSLDAREAAAWLDFVEVDLENQVGWFPIPKPVSCEIAWIEAKDSIWKGRVERLVEFDRSSRTMTLAVTLKTLSVTRVYSDQENVFLSGGIISGDLLITTRLVDPLEDSALKIMNREHINREQLQ